jgi:hypothetical protein
MTEDYLFERVHYQRDIDSKKATLLKPTNSGSVSDPRKLNIDELPPLHRAAARGNITDIISLLVKTLTPH